MVPNIDQIVWLVALASIWNWREVWGIGFEQNMI